MTFKLNAPTTILWSKPGKGKSVYGKIIVIGTVVTNFTIRVQFNILVTLAKNDTDFVLLFFGKQKSEELRSKGFDKWFINLSAADQAELFRLIFNLQTFDDYEQQIPVYCAAMTLLISYLVEQGTTLEEWFTDYKVKPEYRYYEFLVTAFKSIEGSLILSKIKY